MSKVTKYKAHYSKYHYIHLLYIHLYSKRKCYFIIISKKTAIHLRKLSLNICKDKSKTLTNKKRRSL